MSRPSWAGHPHCYWEQRPYFGNVPRGALPPPCRHQAAEQPRRAAVSVGRREVDMTLVVRENGADTMRNQSLRNPSAALFGSPPLHHSHLVGYRNARGEA